MRKALAGLFIVLSAGHVFAVGNLFVNGPRLKVATVGGSVSTYPLVLQFPAGSVVNSGSTATVTFILDAQDEGNFIGNFSTINCVGLGIDCTKSGNVLTITVNGGSGGGGGGGLTIYRNGTGGFSASTINIITAGFITSVVGSSITWGLDPNASFYILNSSIPQAGRTVFLTSGTIDDLRGSSATYKIIFASSMTVNGNAFVAGTLNAYGKITTTGSFIVDRGTMSSLNLSDISALGNVPSLWFGTDRLTGFSSDNMGNLFSIVGGAQQIGVGANAVTLPFTSRFYSGSGSAAAPSLTFSAAPTFGLFHADVANDNYMGLSADGFESIRMITGGYTIMGDANTAGYRAVSLPPAGVFITRTVPLRSLFIVADTNDDRRLEVNGTSVAITSTLVVYGSSTLRGTISSTSSFLLNGGTLTAGVRLPDGSLLVGAGGGSVNSQVYLDTGTFRREYEVFHTTAEQVLANLSASTNSVSADISNLTYYLHTETTGTASAYQLLLSSPMLGAEVVKTKNVTTALGLVKISSHVTRDIDPQVRVINAGIWTFPTWASVDTLGGITQIVVTIATCSYDLTTITEVLSATSPAFVVTGAERFDLVAVQQSDIFLSTSDRILAQYFARTTLALGGNVSLYLGGTSRPTHIEVPISSLYKFTQLADTPKTLVGQRGKYLSVNNDETSTVFVTSPTDITNALTQSTTTLTGKIPVVNIYDEGTVQGNATTLNFVGAAVAATMSGSTGTITITGGGSGSGDNFGSHTATKPVNMGGFGISEASGIIVLNQIAIGTRTPSSTIMLQISSSAEAQNTVIFVQIGTNTTPIYEMTPTSFTCRAATVTFTGTLVVSSKTFTANSGAIVSSLTYKTTGDGIARTQKNAGLEIAIATVPTGNISTMTVIIATVAFNYIVIDASPTVGTNGGDIFIRFNNDASAIYTIGRTTSSGQNISTIKVGSISAVGLSIFGNEIATVTARTVELMFFRNYAQFPKKGLFNAVSIDSANIIPSESRGSFGWLGSAAINRIDVFFSHKGKPASDGATFALGSGIHVYNRDD